MNLLCFKDFERILDNNSCLKTIGKGEQKFITFQANAMVQTETYLPILMIS